SVVRLPKGAVIFPDRVLPHREDRKHEYDARRRRVCDSQPPVPLPGHRTRTESDKQSEGKNRKIEIMIGKQFVMRNYLANGQQDRKIGQYREADQAPSAERKDPGADCRQDHDSRQNDPPVQNGGRYRKCAEVLRYRSRIDELFQEPALDPQLGQQVWIETASPVLQSPGAGPSRCMLPDYVIVRIRSYDYDHPQVEPPLAPEHRAPGYNKPPEP